MINIQDITINGKKVFIRVDFNVPLDKEMNVTDDSRIQGSMRSIKHVIDNDGMLILASHLGRPKAKPEAKYSLSPVAKHLAKMLGKEVKMAPDCIGPEVEKMVGAMKPGDIVMLENVRFHGEEEKNDPEFSKKLAALCDVYVNDAFAASHRAHSSVEGITDYAPISTAGFLMQDEVSYFEKALKNPAKPLAIIIGGAKVSTKLDALNNILAIADKIIIGGAMANTFLKAQGFEVGKSLVENDLLDTARSLLATAKQKGVKIYLPVDAIIARSPEDEIALPISLQDIPEDAMILDIGYATKLLYSQALFCVKTVVWNGPMGMFEIDRFADGTTHIAKSLNKDLALTIVGGGDTVSALNKCGLSDKASYVSTGGGAFLELMEGKVNPAIAALERAAAKCAKM